MPEKYLIPVRNITNNGASATTIIKFPLGSRFFDVNVQMSYTAGPNTIAGAYANINEARLVVNGVTVRKCTGAELRANNVKYGTRFDSVSTEVPNTAPGVSIPIIFAEQFREDKMEIESTALPTNTLNDFSLELDLGAAAAPVIVCEAWVDDVQLKVGTPVKMVTWTRQIWAATAALLEINDILKKGSLLELNLTPPNSTITKCTVIRTLQGDGQTERNVFEATATQNASFLQRMGVTAIAGSFYIVFDSDGLTRSGLDLTNVKNFQLRVETAAAMTGNLSAIIQRLEVVG